MNQRVALHTISVLEREGGATFRYSCSLFATGLRTLLAQFQFRVSGKVTHRRKLGRKEEHKQGSGALGGGTPHLWGKRWKGGGSHRSANLPLVGKKNRKWRTANTTGK